MKKHLYTMYDKVSKEMGPIFDAKNDNTARRIYQQSIRTMPDHVRNDFELYRIMNFDTETMECEADNEMIIIVLEEDESVQELPF